MGLRFFQQFVDKPDKCPQVQENAFYLKNYWNDRWSLQLNAESLSKQLLSFDLFLCMRDWNVNESTLILLFIWVRHLIADHRFLPLSFHMFSGTSIENRPRWNADHIFCEVFERDRGYPWKGRPALRIRTEIWEQNAIKASAWTRMSSFLKRLSYLINYYSLLRSSFNVDWIKYLFLSVIIYVIRELIVLIDLTV